MPASTIAAPEALDVLTYGDPEHFKYRRITNPDGSIVRAPRFASRGIDGVSDRYVHIDTNKFIDMMLAEGFSLVDVKADRVLRRDPLYARHMLSFEAPGAAALREDVRPRQLFINSHNRTTNAVVAQGLIRYACFNGLFVGSVYGYEKARHTGDLASQLIARAQAMARNTAPLFEQIDAWSRIELSEGQTLEFAQRAANLRWGDKAAAYNAIDLLQTRRAEDDGRTLWQVYNRVQENGVKGGQAGRSATGRAIRSHLIGGITASNAYNADLWRLAEEVAKSALGRAAAR